MWPSPGGVGVLQASGVTLSGTLVVSGLAAVLAGGTAVRSVYALLFGSSRLDRELLVPFVAVTAVIALGAAGLPLAGAHLRAGVLSVVPLITVLLLFVPWNVFAFRYAGRGNLLTRRRILAVGALVALLTALYVSVAAGVVQPSMEAYSSVLLIASTLLLGLVALTFVSSGLVLTEAYRHGSIPFASGIAVVFPIAVLVIGIQLVSLSDVLTREFLASLHFLAAAGALPVAVLRYDVLATRPGTTTLGERTVIEDLNEPVLVSDWDGRIIVSNARAEALFGAGLDGRHLEDVLETDVATLREVATLERWTERGYKRFDPRVSSVTGGHDRRLGETVTLIDVTDRAMLRQRVQVLNRIFRHNIRNDLDVIRSQAEVALERWSGETESEAAAASMERILAVTDEIVELSAEAREIEKLTRDSATERSRVALPELVDAVVGSVTRDRSEVSVTVDVSAIDLTVNRELLRFALRNLIENAVEHNDGPSPHVEIRASERESSVLIVVIDDGPGIPDAEWEVIEDGQEEVHHHLRSLGLWGIKWAVQEMGGELSRRERDTGAAVVIDLPRRSPGMDG